MKPLTTSKQVRAFLQLVQYYRKFIKGFAKIAKPLTLLTRQQVKFDWTPTHHATFLQFKEAIVQAPILHYPNLQRNTLCTQTLQMTPAEHNSLKNTMELSSQ